MEESLKHYIEDTILPMYDRFDAAHRRDHVDMAIEQSMEIVRQLDVSATSKPSAPASTQSLTTSPILIPINAPAPSARRLNTEKPMEFFKKSDNDVSRNSKSQ